MDVEKLISLVFEGRSLWDMKDKNYHHRDYSLTRWKKIAEEMVVTGKYMHSFYYILLLLISIYYIGIEFHLLNL